MNIYTSFKPIPKKVLFSLNRYLDISYQPKSSFYKWLKHKLHYSRLLNPSLFLKDSLKYTNKTLTKLNNKPIKNRNWWVSILGLILGLSTHYVDQINTWLEYDQDDILKIYNNKVAQINQQFESIIAKSIQVNVLQNKTVMTQLEKLINSICLSLSIIHITTQNINKLLHLEVIETNSINLTKQIVVQKILRSIAEQKLKSLTVSILQRQDVRNSLHNVIMNYFNGDDFKQLISVQLANLFGGAGYQTMFSNIIKKNLQQGLKNDELKLHVYKILRLKFFGK